MNTPLLIASAAVLVWFGLNCIRTADAFRSYRANRKSETAQLTKRQHDALTAAVCNVLREAQAKVRK